MKIDKKDKEREKEIVLHFDVYYGGKILHYFKMKIDKKDKEREKEIVLHFDVYYGGI
jgi:hypothetical protein